MEIPGSRGERPNPNRDALREILPADSIIERRPSGLVEVRRVHPETRQHLLVMGTDHTRPRTIDSPDIQDLLGQAEAFMQETVGDAREVDLEGRIPAVLHNGRQYPGERLPPVSTDDKAGAVLLHGDMALMACLGVENGCDIKSADDDRSVILRLEAGGLDQAGFTRVDIMRYLIFRQIPQWARTDESLRPPLGDYLQTNVIQRYRTMLGDVWADFDTTTAEVMDMRQSFLNNLSNLEPREVEWFLEESVGHMYGVRPKPGVEPSPTVRVSMAFNRLRDEHFAQVISDGWGVPDKPHKVALLGLAHVEAIAPELAHL